jgi:hypothetical protein
MPWTNGSSACRLVGSLPLYLFTSLTSLTSLTDKYRIEALESNKLELRSPRNRIRVKDNFTRMSPTSKR